MAYGVHHSLGIPLMDFDLPITIDIGALGGATSLPAFDTWLSSRAFDLVSMASPAAEGIA